jgi:hypothetical protein
MGRDEPEAGDFVRRKKGIFYPFERQYLIPGKFKGDGKWDESDVTSGK